MDIGAYTFKEFHQLAENFHGYAAPGLLVGGYMVELAKRHLPEGTLFEAVVESGKCLPDAVQLLTLCSIGNNWMKIHNLGRYAVSLFDKHTGEGVRVSLDPVKMAAYPELKAWFFKEKAKKDQVPGDVIKRAIDKVKNGAVEDYESVQFEGFGPSGSTVIVKCLTDNINRTISQVRPAFTKSKAKLGAEGSVSYLYDTYSILTFKGLDEEQTLEALMEGEADCQEIETHEDGSIELTGAPTDLYKMKDAIEAACPNAEFDVEEIATTPQEYVSLEGEDMELFERLMNLLNACDDVDKIYHNVENYEGE